MSISKLHSDIESGAMEVKTLKRSAAKYARDGNEKQHELASKKAQEAEAKVQGMKAQKAGQEPVGDETYNDQSNPAKVNDTYTRAVKSKTFESFMMGDDII